MFESLRARLDQFLAERTPPADAREQVQALHAALVDAKVGLATMRDALDAAERNLASERRQLADAERRGGMATSIGDAETAEVAGRYAARHAERAQLLERKVAVQRDELALAEREYESMRAEFQQRRGEAPAVPGTGPDVDDAALRHQLDRAARESAAEEQLQFLKRKVRGEG
ncbi:MAG TPA: hypothetical protein VFV65_06825 [Gemmatimonadales bacterium]|nr:hypothetical protein [Gemmatimonadales bacterium]